MERELLRYRGVPGGGLLDAEEKPCNQSAFVWVLDYEIVDLARRFHVAHYYPIPKPL